ncbi:MAG: DUF932 domain-containing protein [Bacteriovoracaceae bacterium]|nr:DUF932 domain-containing protein [candidate division KSB1 bacterium]MBL6991787.1 DUF932 domain-containing protein [Bacteriovoracaceae bacterium]
MAHELYQINGEQSMAYQGKTPWHGLGQSLPEDTPLEVWAKKAHLNWQLMSAPVQYTISNFQGFNKETANDIKETGNLITVPNRKVLYRSDTGVPLSVVSNQYKPVQPAEILDFFKSLINQYNYKMDTAGSLMNGKRIWALARTGYNARIMGQDELRAYLLLATSCDGSLATTAMFTVIRVVCNNTIQMAYQTKAIKREDDLPGVVKVSHISIFDPKKVKMDLGIADQVFSEFVEDAEKLAQTSVSKEEALEFFMDLFIPANKTPLSFDYDQIPDRVLSNIYQTYTSGKGQDLKSSKDTCWGLVNAITRYYDHERQARTTDTRLNNAWFGDGFRMKQKAWDNALKLAA